MLCHRSYNSNDYTTAVIVTLKSLWTFIAVCFSWEELVAVCSWCYSRRNIGKRKRVWWCAMCRQSTVIMNWQNGCRRPRLNSVTGRKKEMWHWGSGKCWKKKNQNYRNCVIQRLYGISCHYGFHLLILLDVWNGSCYSQGVSGNSLTNYVHYCTDPSDLPESLYCDARLWGIKLLNKCESLKKLL